MVKFVEFWDYNNDKGEDSSAVDELNDFIEQHTGITIIETKYQVILDDGKTRTFILLQYKECF